MAACVEAAVGIFFFSFLFLIFQTEEQVKVTRHYGMVMDSWSYFECMSSLVMSFKSWRSILILERSTSVTRPLLKSTMNVFHTPSTSLHIKRLNHEVDCIS